MTRILNIADGSSSATAPTVTAVATTADVVSFDNTGTDFVGDDVQEILEEVDMALKTKLTLFFDTVVAAASSNIPASASLPLQLVASTAQITRRIVFSDDIGELIQVFTGAAASEVLLATFPRGGGTKDVNIPAATRISIRAYENVAITSGFLNATLEYYV